MAKKQTTVRICTERHLKPAKRETAARQAIAENPRNLPSLGMNTRGVMGAPPDHRSRMAMLTGTRWAPGRVLHIKFMGGQASVRKKIEKYAMQWTQYANLQFKFTNSTKAEIRIAFDTNDGSWSYLGTEALSIPKNEPTMNYGWLEPSTEDAEYSRVVLHEFGHALGCIHEHQHPTNGIPWDKQAVYDYYKETDGWSKEEVDDQIFFRYTKSETNFSSFDRKSIMLYAVPNELTLGNYSVGWNTKLSASDKKFMATMYPDAQPPTTTLTIGGAPVAASIGTRGEEDLFEFKVPKTGRYEIITSGPTNVVAMLLGPDSETRLVAEDDDSGYRRNAKISEILMPGTYYARIRHFSKSKTGKYKIRVRKRPL